MSSEQDDIFNEEELEEGELEETKEDDNDEELWGGTGNNEVINPDIHPNINIIAAIIGLQPIRIPPEPESPIQQSGRIRRRVEITQQSPNKSYRDNTGKRIIREPIPSHNYIKLKSGEEIHFEENDGKNIIINEALEPNRLIRNIISKVPIKLSERLYYLGKFVYDEDFGEDDNDVNEEENEAKVQKRYVGNLKDVVYSAYIKEWRLRYLFKRVSILWRSYKMDKMYEKEIDPITLSEPEKEVYVYDWANKRKFVFDAKSLATLIESKLMYHEYGFPVPQYPRNPKNNVEFNYRQLVSIYYQLKAHGELRWGFTTLREYNFNKNRWHMYHKSALTMNSIKFSIYLLDTFEARELFIDFIFAKMDEIGFRHTTYIYDVYQTALVRAPTHWYLEKLKPLALSHYEAEHFGQNRERIINAACINIFRKHNQFIKDLRTKNIIR